MQTVKRALTLGITVSLLVIGGCKSTQFVIEMQPHGNVMERTVTIDVAGEELDRLAGLYGTVPGEETLAELEEKRTVKYTVNSRFTSRMPADVGGSGYLLYYDSPFGSSSLYTEKFRGHDDLAGMIDVQRLAFDRLVDVVLLWYEFEAADEPGYEEVRAFLDTDFREDLWNILLLANTMDTIGPLVMPADAGVDTYLGMNYGLRVLHFLADRDYIDPVNLSRYALAVNQLNSGHEGPFLELLTETITRKIGRDDVPDALRLLALDDGKHLPASWERFNAESDELRALVETWYEGKLDDDYDPEDAEYLEDLWDGLTGSTFFSIDDGSYLDVTLHLPTKPYDSNGLWNDAGTLTWEQPLASTSPTAAELPNVLYAAWSEPDIEFQAKHFGGTVIEDEDMLDYVMWYGALSDGQRDEWNAFVSNLEPGAEIQSTLMAFVFSEEADRPIPEEADAFRSLIARPALFRIAAGLKRIAGSPDAAREPDGTN